MLINETLTTIKNQAKEYLKELGVPDGYKSFASVALGYKKIEAINAPPRKPNIINYIK